jgi:hypothetical protein
LRRAFALLGLVVLAAGCGGTRTVVRTVTVAPTLGGNADQAYYGRIVSLTRSGDGYLLRFDPAWWLTGITANVAAAADQHLACRPAACPPVPNDYYALDESHRTLTFRVPATASAYVLTPKQYVSGTKIGVAELAALVAGKSPVKLFEPLESGVWLRTHGDSVLAFKQQYRP